MANEKDSLLSYLANLMMHIIKWKSQPKKRTPSWKRSIDNARIQMADIQKKKPSLTKKVIESIWAKAFKKAKREAEKEMDQPTKIQNLSWKEVFEDSYDLGENYWKLWTVLLGLVLLFWWIW
jgi:Domain of unknown function DUF29